MLTLRESAAGLTIAYPLWLGLLLLAMGVALVVYLVRGKARAGKIFGVSAAALICLGGGVHFAGYKATLSEEGARVYAPLRVDDRIAWPEVVGTRVEVRPSSRGGPSRYLVLLRPAGAGVDILISGLSGEEVVTVMDYVGKQAQK